jgi:23S rRNA pseudouridine1911/1915/1917 synthase
VYHHSGIFINYNNVVVLVNDEKYGGDKILKGTTFTKYKQFIINCFNILPRQALHAFLLEFTHPTTGKRMLFEAPLPNDFNKLIGKWREYARHKDTMNEYD